MYTSHSSPLKVAEASDHNDIISALTIPFGNINGVSSINSSDAIIPLSAPLVGGGIHPCSATSSNLTYHPSPSWLDGGKTAGFAGIWDGEKLLRPGVIPIGLQIGAGDIAVKLGGFIGCGVVVGWREFDTRISLLDSIEDRSCIVWSGLGCSLNEIICFNMSYKRPAICHRFSPSMRILKQIWTFAISFTAFCNKPDFRPPQRLRTMIRPDVKAELMIIGVIIRPLVKATSNKWIQLRAAFVQIASDTNDRSDFFVRNGLWTWIWM